MDHQRKNRAGLGRARNEGKASVVPQLCLHSRNESARLWPLLGGAGVRVIAKQFGVHPGTVQRISRPFEQDAVAL
jgi:hypothetical protein